ncbi:Phage tail fibers [Enterobacter hormaechei]|nr:Phage tail fibers [Enterobacter hormaechei]
MIFSAGGYVSWQLASTSQGLKYRQGNGTIQGNANVGFSTTHTIYSTQNTTKASDGTLKAASPIARIVKSQEENQRTDVDEVGFTWCGCGTANTEAEGIKISRLDVGVYVLIGSAGLASEAGNCCRQWTRVEWENWVLLKRSRQKAVV